MPDLSLVLPVLNEEDIITPVINDIVSELDKEQIDYEIVMVDNGSTDNSLAVIEKLSKINPKLRSYHLDNKGWGLSIKKGWSESKGKFVAHMVSDGQVEPKTIVTVYQEIKKGQYDLVKILRKTRENKLRKVNSFCYNIFANILFGIGTHDTNGCPKIFPRELLEKLSIQANDSFLDLELLAKARYLRLRIREIPTPGLKRVGGKSNTSIKTVLEFINNMVRFRFGNEFNSWKKA